MITYDEFRAAFDSAFLDELLGKDNSPDERARVFELAKERAVRELAPYKVPDDVKRSALLDLVRVRLLERYHLPAEEMDALRRYAESVVARLREQSVYEPMRPHVIGARFFDESLMTSRPNKRNNQLGL